MSDQTWPELDALLDKLDAARLPEQDVRRKLREDAGLSLREAAKVLNVSPVTLLRWENATSVPRNLDSAARYAMLLAALEARR